MNPTAPTTGWLERLTARLRRVTTSGRFLPEVDGLRFIAISFVVLLHLHGRVVLNVPHTDEPDATWLGWAIEQGNLGVLLFFTISGFILALPFAEQHLLGARAVSLRDYYWRRVTRLEPPYIIAMTLAFALQLLRAKWTFAGLFPHLAASLGYLHNQIYQDASPINPVAWSLEVEVQFYLLAPLLAGVFRLGKVTRRALLAVGVLVLSAGAMPFWRLLGVPNPDYSILGQLQFFLAGFLLADLHVSRTHDLKPFTAGWDVAGLVALCGLPAAYASTSAGWLFFPLTVFILFLAVLRGKIVKAALAHPLVSAGGGMCYSIYLLHLPVLSGAISFSRQVQVSTHYLPNLLVQCALVLPVLLLVSSIFFLLVEKPCMDKRWPSRLLAWFQSLRSRTSPAGEA